MVTRRWTRLLAMALVLPLAAACAEGGEDEIEDAETLETAPTTMDRVELEPFGTADIEGWVTSRTEGDELVLTLNLDRSRTGPTGEMGTEGEMMGTEDEMMGTEGEMGMEGTAAHPGGERSARLIEGMCMDVRPESGQLGQTARGETGTEQTPGTEEQPGVTGADEEVRTVAEFERPEEQSGMGMNGHTLEARVSQSELTGQSYAVVVEGSDDGMSSGQQSEPAGGSDAIACADVTLLIQSAGSASAGSRGAPMGSPGTSGTEGGSDESGSNY